ncbi:MAG TPA: hypothetical protein VF847_02850 [Candidatus Deferrimicrobiaceae bacterium]
MTRSSRIIRGVGIALAAFALCGIVATAASATPSTQIWIPSTDIQPFKTVHLGFDTYIRTSDEPSGVNLPPFVDLGVTAGVLPFEKFQMEVGFDLQYGGANTSAGLDGHPLYFNAKVGIPEDAFFKWQPAVAFGGYNFGTKSGELDEAAGSYTKTGTNANIWYGLVAKTLPVVGRFSVGYYGLNKKASVATVFDAAGAKGDANGLLASWDRTMKEISDKLWVAVDYQGGKNAYGATSFGASWAFAKNVSVLVGYDIYNNKARGGANTATVQIDINFP